MPNNNYLQVLSPDIKYIQFASNQWALDEDQKNIVKDLLSIVRVRQALSKNNFDELFELASEWRDGNFLWYLTIAFFESGIEFMESISAIQAYQFMNLAIDKAIIPGNIKVIKRAAFNGCNLKTVEFEEGVERIEDFAFTRNRKLEEVRMPASMKFVSPNAFSSKVKIYKK